MAELKKHIYDENNGLYYTLVGDCYILDLKLSEGESCMGDLLSCEFNIDTGCIELHYADEKHFYHNFRFSFLLCISRFFLVFMRFVGIFHFLLFSPHLRIIINKLACFFYQVS